MAGFAHQKAFQLLQQVSHKIKQVEKTFYLYFVLVNKMSRQQI